MKTKKGKGIALVVITALITLSPMIGGIMLWDKLPNEVATSFSMSGKATDYSSKAFAVFGLPAMLAVFHLFAVIMTSLDPKFKNIPKKGMRFLCFICPAVSVMVCGMIYAEAMGSNFPITKALVLFIGVLFAVIGNYLPKCKLNYSFGIRLPWTMADEEVWNKTHRLAGFLWTVGGIVIAVSAFFAGFAVLFAVLAVIAIVPMVYSFVIYKRKQ